MRSWPLKGSKPITVGQPGFSLVRAQTLHIPLVTMGDFWPESSFRNKSLRVSR